MFGNITSHQKSTTLCLFFSSLIRNGRLCSNKIYKQKDSIDTMPPKAKPSSSGKSSGKSGGKAEDEIENNRKAIRKFLKTYEKSCQDKGLVLLPSISQKLNRLVKSEEGPNTLNIPFLITEELSLEAVQALIESLDSSIQGYEKISF